MLSRPRAVSELDKEYRESVFGQKKYDELAIGRILAIGCFVAVEALLASFIRYMMQTFDCSRQSTCMQILDVNAQWSCCQSTSHRATALAALAALVALYPAVCIARGFLQFMHRDLTIWVQQRLVFVYALKRVCSRVARSFALASSAWCPCRTP